MENFIKLKRENNFLIADFIGDSINTMEFDLLINSARSMKNFPKLFLNIANLKEINNDAINKFRKLSLLVKDKEVAFINVSALQNSILNIVGLDRVFNIYMNINDAKESKKPVINRKLRLISC